MFSLQLILIFTKPSLVVCTDFMISSQRVGIWRSLVMTQFGMVLALYFEIFAEPPGLTPQLHTIRPHRFELQKHIVLE